MYYKQNVPDAYQYEYHHNHIQFSTEIYRVGTYHYNWHPETEILLILQGRVEVVHDGEKALLGPLDVAIFSPQTGHATLALEPDTVAMVMHLHPSYWQEWDIDFGTYYFYVQTNPSTLHNDCFTTVRAHLAVLALKVLEKSSPLRDVCIEASCSAIVYAVYELIRRVQVLRTASASVKGADEVFAKMVHYVERNYQHKIEMEDIARIGGYNVSYTSQFFKRQMGITFGEYIMRLRLREAIVALVNSDDKIVEVANQCGFSDVKAFNTAFKKHFSKTPSEYRVKARQLNRRTTVDNWKEYIPISDDGIKSQLVLLSTSGNEGNNREEVASLIVASAKRHEALTNLQEEMKRLQKAVEALTLSDEDDKYIP